VAWDYGNKYGRLGAPVSQALRRAALAGDAVLLRRAADRVLQSAADGETWQERMSAIEFLADRLEGKAVARVESSNADARELDLAAVMHLVLQHRKANAVDVQPAQADTAQADTAQAVDASIPALPQKP
jgi:hypothetical protein